MARPRSFDPDVAVDRAMRLFWQNGYEATSMDDLVNELGLGRGSLYAAFGSKDGLYARALERYVTDQATALVAALTQATELRPALRTLLTGIVTADLAAPERGCLLVKAATERAGDAGTTARVGEALQVVEAGITTALERARARGEISDDKDPVALARFFTTFIQGLRVMGNARSDRRTLDDAITAALGVLT